MAGGRAGAGVALLALAPIALAMAGCSEQSPEQEDLASPARSEASPTEREELREPRDQRRDERGEHTEAPYAPTD